MFLNRTCLMEYRMDHLMLARPCSTRAEVDLQVNGGGGVLFNSAPDVQAIRKIGEAHRRCEEVGGRIADTVVDFAGSSVAIQVGQSRSHPVG